MIFSTASSRRSSEEISKNHLFIKNQSNNYSKWRIDRNRDQLKTLQNQINTAINGSYAFTAGAQQTDDNYNRLFIDFFREMRGGDHLTNQSSQDLAKTLCYEDIAEMKQHWVYEPEEQNHLETTYHPKEDFKQELEKLLDECSGFNGQFLKALKENSKCFIDGLELKQRDTYLSSIPVFSRVFPRCYGTLKAIFADLLSSKWLEKDIYATQDSISQNNTIDRLLWKSAQYAGQLQRERDQDLAKKHNNDWKNDVLGMAISGALSYKTKNPIFIAGQLVRAITNAISRNTDPEGQDLELKILTTLANTGTALVDGPSKVLGVALAFDVADLYNRHGVELSNKEEVGRNIALTFVKSLLTGTIHGDDERYLKDILGGLTSEVLNQLPETDENTTFGKRVLRAIVTHPDVQGELIDRAFKKSEVKQPKESAEEKTEQPVEEVKKGFDDQWVQDLVAHEEQQKALKLEAQRQYEQELAEYNRQVAYVESVNKAIQDIKDKQTQVRWSSYDLEKRLKKFNKKKHRKSLWKKAKKATKEVNIANIDLHTAINHYNALTGSSERVHPTKIKNPKKPSWDDRLGSRLAAMGVESINVSVSVPLYPTKTPNLTDRHPIETTPPVNPTPPSINEPKPREFTFQDMQRLQEQRVFEANMGYRTPKISEPQQTQHSPNIGDWKQGIIRSAQRTPRIHYGSFGSAQMKSPAEAQMIHRAVNNDFTKSIPKGVGKVAKALFSLMLPDMSARPGAADPKREFKKICRNLGKLYDKKVAIQNPDSLAAKSGEFVGEMVAFGGMGKVIRVAKGVSVFARASEGGLYGAIISEAHETNRAAGIAFGFTGGALTTKLLFRREAAKPLLDRALVRPEGFGRQLQLMKAIEQRAYRSGIGSPWSEMGVGNPKILEKLRNSSSHITPQQLKRLEGRVSNWLGDGTKLIKNKAGDPVFLSKDKTRRVRFDFNRPDPHNNVHCHVESYINGKWFKSGPIYPIDVPHN